MPTPYTKDKAFRITLRLNEQQFDFVKENADVLGVSPSEFLRMVVNSTMAATQKAAARMNIARDAAMAALKESEGEGRANDEAYKYNIV